VDPVAIADHERSGKNAGMAARHSISLFMMRLVFASSGIWLAAMGLARIADADASGSAQPETIVASVGDPPSVSARPPLDALALSPDRIALLPGAADPTIRARWQRATSLESTLHFDEAAVAYQSLIELLPGSSSPYWRVSRVYWRLGDGMPPEDKEGQLLQYTRAADWAQRGIEIDPKCAECMLWNYAALGRLTMTEGILSGLRRARTMSRMLDRGIELAPTHRDNPYNSTLGNLYYARAVFNRMVPDWWFLPLVAGVKGDKRQALEDIDHAVALDPGRIDYSVEKGAVLLCLGADRAESALIEDGRRVLNEAMTLERRLESDDLDVEFARVLLREPEKACGYSRAGFVDLDEYKGKL
jgi:tetratricopeptide (TPR) repeat protein